MASLVSTLRSLVKPKKEKKEAKLSLYKYSEYKGYTICYANDQGDIYLFSWSNELPNTSGGWSWDEDDPRFIGNKLWCLEGAEIGLDRVKGEIDRRLASNEQDQ